MGGYDTTFGYGEIVNFQNLFIAIENFEARAVPLHSISVTPRKLCLAPKVLLGGLRDRTVQYATLVWGMTNFSFFPRTENFEAEAVRLY